MRATLRMIAATTVAIGAALSAAGSERAIIFIWAALLVFCLSFWRMAPKRQATKSVKEHAGKASAILFFDVETTGLPKRRGASYREVNVWPRVVSLGWMIANDQSGYTHTGY